MFLTLHIAGRHILTIGDPPDDQEPDGDLAWTIDHDHLRHMLNRAATGEDPGMLMLELCANTDTA